MGLGGVFGLIEVCDGLAGHNKGLCVNLKSQREGIGPRQGRGAQEGGGGGGGWWGDLSSFQCIHAFGFGVQRRGGTGEKIGEQEGIV